MGGKGGHDPFHFRTESGVPDRFYRGFLAVLKADKPAVVGIPQPPFRDSVFRAEGQEGDEFQTGLLKGADFPIVKAPIKLPALLRLKEPPLYIDLYGREPCSLT